MALPTYPQYSVGGDAPQQAAATPPISMAPQTPQIANTNSYAGFAGPLTNRPYMGAGGVSSVGTSTSTTNASSTATGDVTKVLPTGPYPDRELPSWLPPSADFATGELAQEYANVPAAYDTSAVDAASAQQQQRDLTGGLRAANAAAASYAARTQQAGGSIAAEGLIKAQGQIGALNAAGQAKVEAAKYDVQQREAAAGQAAQIAGTLSGLRTDYLKTLTGYAAAEDVAAIGTKTQESQQSSETTAQQQAASGSGSGSGGLTPDSRYTIIPNAHGLASGLDPVSYQSSTGRVDRPQSVSGATFANWNPSGGY